MMGEIRVQLSSARARELASKAVAVLYLSTWAAAFAPCKDEAAAFLGAFDVNAAVWRGQAAVFGCVGRELIQQQRNRRDRVSAHRHVRSVDYQAGLRIVVIAVVIWRKDCPNERVHRRGRLVDGSV